MAKIYILGNKPINTLLDATLISCNPSVKNDPKQLHIFICTHFSELTKDDKIIIDLDSLDSFLGLLLSLHIRMSVTDLKIGSLAPIIFLSELPINIFLKYGEVSQILLSENGAYFTSLSELNLAIDNSEPLSLEDYNASFLDNIHISPNAVIGHHSIANIWGADVFKRMIGFKEKHNMNSYTSRYELYYKYVFLKTQSIRDLFEYSDEVENRHSNRQINAIGKNILLIDDEAEKGWEDALKFWFKDPLTFDVVNEQIGEYDEIPTKIKSRIESSFYDLYLLDLRLLGTKEEGVLDPKDFSGMKILSEIKAKNKGNQVLIMTASNKAWNMKALFDVGVDGYYIKESPEYHFPEQQSVENYKSFEHDVSCSINARFKRELWTAVNEICDKISNCFDDDFLELKLQLKSTLISSVTQAIEAKTNREYANSFLNLFQFFEIITREYIIPVDNYWIINCPNEYHLKKFKLYTTTLKPNGDIKKPKENKNFSPAIKDKILNLYYHLGTEKKASFRDDYLDLIIKRRNPFVHGDMSQLTDPEIRKVYTSEGFIHEFEAVKLMSDILF